MMYILILLLLLSIIATMYFFSDYEPISIEKLSGYNIPKIFFSDYNKICMMIYQMTRQTEDDVMHEITSFEDKYAQIIDDKIYHERMAYLLEQFRKRSFFLNYNK